MVAWVGFGGDGPERAADNCQGMEISTRDSGDHTDTSRRSLIFSERSTSSKHNDDWLV